MRIMALTIGILAAGIAHAAGPGLPGGNYSGTATWRGPGGTSGTYAVEKSISGSTITSHYTWTQPQAREETHSMTFVMKENEPRFDILDKTDQVVGTGYCYEDSCAYRATFGPVTVDETLRWERGSLIATGAKSGPGFSVVWKETLRSR